MIIPENTLLGPTQALPKSGDAWYFPWTFHLVTDYLELQALIPAWKKLLKQSAVKEPMQDPDWLLTWWEIYGQNHGRELCIGILREGERLVGLAPLCRRRVWYCRSIPFTRLEFLGADVEEDDGVCSAYLDLLAVSGQEERVAESFCAAIVARSFGQWHEVVLGMLNGGNGAPERLLTAFGKVGYQATLQTMTEAPYADLPASWDTYLMSLPKKDRHDIRRALKDFEEWAGTDWKLDIARTPEELATGRQILEKLHQERWQEGAGMDGCFASPRFGAFHQTYMAKIFQENQLELSWLTVHGTPINVAYQIVANRKVYFYMCGRSMRVPPRVRSGMVMAALSLQRAIAAGMREFDFLRGLAQYKAKFTHTNRAIVQVRAVRAGFRERLRQGTKTTWNFLPRLFRAHR